MVINEDNIAEFVHKDIVHEIARSLPEKSVKLIGLPRTGISCIMQYVHQQAKNKMGYFDSYIPFYIKYV